VDKTAIRHAATVILVRDPASEAPQVLMGQRGANAAFMPNKFVFPGGAVDAGDAVVPLRGQPNAACAARIAQDAGPDLTHALFAAAIRELFEETGLALGTQGTWPSDVPPDWAEFAQAGLTPDASALSFVFRAITPPGRPRRFDARFFLAEASALVGDADDFSRASDELSHLQWIPLPEVRSFTLPLITEVVLAEISAALPQLGAPASVPFFDNSGEESVFRRIA
jgi:8-oxo-dGTP pyrophosphatase MutT (NUDIX family)